MARPVRRGVGATIVLALAAGCAPTAARRSAAPVGGSETAPGASGAGAEHAADEPGAPAAAPAPVPAPALAPAPELPETAALRALLGGRDFAALETELARWAATADAQPLHERAAVSALEALATGRPAEAEALDAWAKASPGWAAHTARALERGDRDDAMAAIAAARPAPVPAYVAFFRAGRAATQRRANAEVLERALAEHPASYEIRRAYAETLLPRWGGSYAAVERVAAAAAAELPANARLACLHGIADADRARSALARGNLVRALELLDAAVAHGDCPELLAERGHVQLARGDHPAALADLDAALAGDPSLVAAIRDRAVVLYLSGRRDEGLAALARAEELAPGDRGAAEWRARWAADHLRRAAALAATGQPSEALAEYDAALSLAPGDAAAHHGRGLALVALGRSEEAVAAFEEALALEPRRLATFEALAAELARRGEWRRHLALWNRLLAREPGNARALLGRSEAEQHLGDRRRAVEDAERACGLGERRACAYLERIASVTDAPPAARGDDTPAAAAAPPSTPAP